MPHLQGKSFKSPEQIRRFPNARIETVSHNAATIGRFFMEPGWRWSPDVVPIANTRSWQIHHLGVVPKGRFPNETDADEECELGIDGVDEHPPGRDGFVVSAEPLEAIEFAIASSTQRSLVRCGRALAPALGGHGIAIRSGFKPVRWS